MAIVLTVALLTTILLLPEPRSPSGVAAVSGVLSLSVVTVCAVFLYLHSLLTSTTSVAWLTVVAAVVGIHGLAMSGLYLGGPGGHRITAYSLASEVLIALLVVVMARAADRVTLPVDPVALGLVGGLLIAVLDIVVARTLDLAPIRASGWTWGGAVTVLAIGVLVAHRVGRLSDLAPRVRSRLRLAILALFVSRAAVLASTTGDGATLLAVVTGFAGALLLSTTCLAMLRGSIREGRDSIAVLHARAHDLETRARADRERLHEVRGTIAGIASASDLIRRIEPSGPQRPGLEQMIALETARLDRLLHGEEAAAPEVLDLDALIRPLVLAHRARGHDVRWSATGHLAVAASDHLTEALNIVLNNAASHGAPGTTHIEVTQDAGHVKVRVCDDGPGVPEELVESVFEWGTRGVQSAGSGIGLNLACRLLRQDGHHLELDRGYRRGAAFLIDLGPAPAHGR